MSAREKSVRVLFVLLVMPLLGLLLWTFVLQPVKYRYLIWRVESARTAAEEMAAFTVAADRGRVWEVDRLRPEDAVADGRQMTGDWLLRLEWLPSSPFGGGAYAAYRAVTDTNNCGFCGIRSIELRKRESNQMAGGEDRRAILTS